MWPSEVEIPPFSVAAEAVLRNANEQFLKDGTVLNNTRVRRQDVVSLQLSITEIKERWPALFDAPQVNAEFHRIATRHRAEINIVLQSGIPIEKTREVVIRCLIDHLGEDVGALIKEFETSDDSAINVEEELAAEMMALL
ncbi:unnamed protein product [Arctogadus glacialis]